MNAAVPPVRRARRWLSLAAFILGCQLVGIVGAATTVTGTSTWYAELIKPSFQPPSWLFGPVWTLLYTLMGIAAWRVWTRTAQSGVASHGRMLFLGQMALNAAWTPVFFGAHQIGLALAILIALVVLLAATLHSFRRIDRVASWLLVPYLVWVCFATVLNAAIFQLN